MTVETKVKFTNTYTDTQLTVKAGNWQLQYCFNMANTADNQPSWIQQPVNYGLIPCVHWLECPSDLLTMWQRRGGITICAHTTSEVRRNIIAYLYTTANGETE